VVDAPDVAKGTRNRLWCGEVDSDPSRVTAEFFRHPSCPLSIAAGDHDALASVDALLCDFAA
jgi:hypothetical protein